MASLHDDDDSSAFLFRSQEGALQNANSAANMVSYKRKASEKAKEDTSNSRSLPFIKLLKNFGNRMTLSSASDHSTASYATDDCSVNLSDDKDQGESASGSTDAADYGYGFAAPDRDPLYICNDSLKLSGIKWKKTSDNEKYAQLLIVSQETVVLVRRAPAPSTSSRTRRQVTGRERSTLLRRTASSNGRELTAHTVKSSHGSIDVSERSQQRNRGREHGSLQRTASSKGKELMAHDGMDVSERSQQQFRPQNLNFDDNIRCAAVARAPPVRRTRRRASM
jgi:hypothetical protein